MKSSVLQKPYLTPNELAELLMVSPVTVRHWANKGWIEAVLTPGGHRRFVREEVERFAQERGLSLHTESDEPLRVLVVDDEPAICEAVEELVGFASRAITTETANSGFEAGFSVHSFKPHVILLDLMMPEMDGFEVCRRLRSDAATESMSIIAMTGYYSEENHKRILEAGAEHCLKKPLDPDELLSKLETVPASSRKTNAAF